jgi:hypothetical protein
LQHVIQQKGSCLVAENLFWRKRTRKFYIKTTISFEKNVFLPKLLSKQGHRSIVTSNRRKIPSKGEYNNFFFGTTSKECRSTWDVAALPSDSFCFVFSFQPFFLHDQWVLWIVVCCLKVQ